MCSIAGFISKSPLSRAATFQLCRALLHYGSERGTQSTGIWINGQLLKEAVSPEDFTETPAFRALMKGGSKMALLHTRQPTHGGRTDADAQPFAVPIEGTDRNVISVHNGVCSNHEELATEYEVTTTTQVDSEIYPAIVAKHGIEELPNALFASKGANTVAMVVDGHLYFCRDGNPVSLLHLNFLDGNHITIFASTDDILMNAARFVWLLQRSHKPVWNTETRQLYEVTPTAIEKIGSPISFGTVHPFPKGVGAGYKKSKKDRRAERTAERRLERMYGGGFYDSRDDYGRSWPDHDTPHKEDLSKKEAEPPSSIIASNDSQP